ncbi:class II aldolase/adducin family protein [Amycolatopsis echigonensis]|uniref:Aldolase n=1 Tax=Amycolatopsis echigonensis TaxID=2576905 RepID=A0A8E1T174_9PSEU|nr:aldolase [Amycolatopsis echigonensis]MBB2497695.1 aldolase [Amycolatopsis echigonensis]
MTGRADVVRAGASLFARGYVHASAGNISMRVDDGYLITPTDAPLGFLEADRLAHVAADGAQLSGDRASKTLALHRRIYAAVPSARVVIHTHATHLVALTLLGVWSQDDILPPLTPYQVMKVGHLPLIPYRRPGDPEVADLVEAAIAARPSLRAVMLERLGPVVWGPDVATAMATLEEAEETARLWVLTGHRPRPLADSAIAELRDAFSAPW